ncbi:MAG: YdcF family protein, partial [Cyanobacteria bacterium]|nr:YdcF family protein [Cyanobacteriota bacterium]MDW8201619.1 YdcF family protein [Cyanobacteriota bacterium SKYGB_h_bin112]
DRAGIPRDRVHLDYQAVDTVTNFTVMARIFTEQNIHSVYLITSDYHMRRARVIGAIVFGSRNIHIHPVIVPSRRDPEPISKAVRDGLRALVWLFTGYTGTLAP